MTTVYSGKNFLAKFVAVFVVVALIFGFVPVLDNADLSITASADAPVYDSTLGRYESTKDANGNTVLTAIPNAGCGFRGWFLKDGTEVSYKESCTLPSGANQNNYVPVFYDFNLSESKGFEQYAVGTNMKTGVPTAEIWEGTCDTEALGGKDWTLATITNTYARTGTKSLEAFSMSNATYHEFANLETDTQYTLSFWYYIPPTEDNKNKMNFVTVVPEDVSVTARANGGTTENDKYIAQKVFDGNEGTEGVCEEGVWKNVSLTFYSDYSTKVKLAFSYGTSNNSKIYIDDVSLIKDIAAAPTYYTDDFRKNINSWTTSNSANAKISWFSNSWLKVEGKNNGGHIYSAPFQVKKDAKYTLKIYANFMDVTDPKFSDLDTGNWINLALTTVPGYIESYRYYNSSKASTARFKWTISDKNGNELADKTKVSGNYGSCYTGFTAADYCESGNVIITATFTAHKTAELYLNSRLNGKGTYYIDKLEIIEDTESFDKVAYLKENAISQVGSAIRTEGVQGLRYKTEIDKHFLTADMSYGARFLEYGTLAIKSDILGDNELVLDGQYASGDAIYGAKKGVAYSFENNVDKVFEDNFDTLRFTGVLTNISSDKYNTNYTVRAYFKYVDADGNEGVIYAPQEKIAIYPVAKAAYSKRNSKNEFVESETVRQYLYDNIINKFADKVINVSNASTPLYNNFQGISSTVYHGTIFFPDSHNRTYTDAQAQVEIDRLVDSNVTNVRTRLASQWMWKDGTGWNWNSDQMKAFYKWGKLIQQNGITITLNAGWHLTDFIAFYNFISGTTPLVSSGNKHSSIKEVGYLHGYTDDGTKITNLYGEDSKASALASKAKSMGLNLTDSELSHYSVAAVRYGEWIKQALLKLKANGLNNVEYVIPFTETGYYTETSGTSNGEKDPTYSYDEWIIMTMGLQDALVAAGIRNDYKLIGPSQSEHARYNRQVRFVEYLYEKINDTDYEDMLDINSMHCYPNPGSDYADTVYDPEAIYANADEEFSWFNDILVNAGVRDKEFWCDEYFTMSGDADLGENVGMQATQFAAGITAGMKYGINRFISWQMFDTLWDGNAKHTTGQFVGGIHRVGTCPALVFVDGKNCTISGCTCKDYQSYSSYLPRDTYYGINLIGKYMNNENAKVFATEILDSASDNGDIYIGAIENDNGKNVILVVNTLSQISTVEINLEKATGKSFKRYLYNPNEIVATAEAKSIPSDKTISLNGTSFYDGIEAQSFAIYVEN